MVPSAYQNANMSTENKNVLVQHSPMNNPQLNAAQGGQIPIPHMMGMVGVLTVPVPGAHVSSNDSGEGPRGSANIHPNPHNNLHTNPMHGQLHNQHNYVQHVMNNNNPNNPNNPSHQFVYNLNNPNNNLQQKQVRSNNNKLNTPNNTGGGHNPPLSFTKSAKRQRAQRERNNQRREKVRNDKINSLQNSSNSPNISNAGDSLKNSNNYVIATKQETDNVNEPSNPIKLSEAEDPNSNNSNGNAGDTVKTEERGMDWLCPKCQERNYQYRRECRKCGQVRTKEAKEVTYIIRYNLSTMLFYITLD